MQPFSAQVSGTATAVTTGPCRIVGGTLNNTTAAIAYVQIFNKAVANVTLGTTTPDFVIGIPASGSIPLPALEIQRNQLSLNVACTVACTTGRANSTGAAVDLLLLADTNF